MHQYDTVIIGSGLGGLLCGAILAKHGHRVCILEKNQQIGGCLQTFVRDRTIFDSGVHYVGGLAPGQNLYKVFKYLGILDKMQLERLNMEGFDHIGFAADPREYRMAQGYEAFTRNLLKDFPGEQKALREYGEMIRHVCSRFPLYNLRAGSFSEKESVLGIDAAAFMNSLSNDRRFTQVLAGTNLLYAGVEGRTPFYVHALVLNSYIESAWRFINGGSQIGKWLARVITEHHGTILRYREVKRIVAEGDRVSYVETATGEHFTGTTFISNAHPANTLAILESDSLRQAYRHRISNLENTTSTLLLNIVMQPGTFPAMDHNYYHHTTEDVWNEHAYTKSNWPLGYALFCSPDLRHPGYAASISVMAYMNYADVMPWADTFNTTANENDRGPGYEAFKNEKAARLLDVVTERFPQLRECMQSCYTATPLTFRDYIGTFDGSLYGVQKNSSDPMRTFIGARTKLSNLYLTGQNLNMHGILGVAMSAIMTCSELLDMERLLHDINEASS